MKEVLRRHSEFLPQGNILIKRLKASPDLLRGEENLVWPTRRWSSQTKTWWSKRTKGQILGNFYVQKRP